MSAAHRTVLVVDDEPLIRELVVEALEEEGWVVLEASAGPTALEVLATAPALAALVVDIHLPGEIDGLALIDRAHELHPEAAIVVMSGAIARGRRVHPQKAFFLQKPFAIDALVLAVSGAAHGGSPTR